MALSSKEKEIECVVHWFQNWSPMQKGDFLNDLLDKAVPAQLDTLMSAIKTMNVDDLPPSIFQCQLKLFTQWFSEWSDRERNDFILKLCEKDSAFVEKFNEALSKACS